MQNLGGRLSIISSGVWNTGRPVLGEVGGVKVIDIDISVSPPECPILNFAQNNRMSLSACQIDIDFNFNHTAFILFYFPGLSGGGQVLQQGVLRTPSTREN